MKNKLNQPSFWVDLNTKTTVDRKRKHSPFNIRIDKRLVQENVTIIVNKRSVELQWINIDFVWLMGAILVLIFQKKKFSIIIYYFFLFIYLFIYFLQERYCQYIWLSFWLLTFVVVALLLLRLLLGEKVGSRWEGARKRRHSNWSSATCHKIYLSTGVISAVH